MDKDFYKDYEKKFFLLILISFILNVPIYWINQKALMDKLNIPVLLLISDLNLSLLLAPIEQTISNFLKPRYEWQLYSFYFSITLTVIHEICSIFKDFYKENFGDKENPTKLAQARRFFVYLSMFVFVFPFLDIRIFLICSLIGVYLFFERDLIPFLLLLVAFMFLFLSLAKDAVSDGESSAIQCQHPVVLRLKAQKDNYLTGCWIFENSKSVLIKSNNGQTGKSLNAIIYSKDDILSYSFIGEKK